MYRHQREKHGAAYVRPTSTALYRANDMTIAANWNRTGSSIPPSDATQDFTESLGLEPVPETESPASQASETSFTDT